MQLNRYLYLFLLLGAVACSQSRSAKTYKVEGFTQGTVFSIIYQDSLNRDFSAEFDSIFNVVDSSMSIYNSGSVISRLNRNETDMLDPLLEQVLKLSFAMNRKTDGAFDITVGPVVRTIGFGPDSTRGIDSVRIKKLLRLIGMQKIRLDGNRLIKDDQAIQIDLNAIAQGYTSDLVARYLLEQGVKNFLVEVGGEIAACGLNPSGKQWIIGIDKPKEGALPGESFQAKLSLPGGRGLATSGNYRKFIEVDGIKYAHTIDPKTGLPVMSNLLSATVIAGSAAEADALATAFMVRGLEWSRSFLIRNPDIGALLIYSDSTGKLCNWANPAVTELLLP